MSTHTTWVNRAIQRNASVGEIDIHWAECDCGWQGNTYGEDDTAARNEALAHGPLAPEECEHCGAAIAYHPPSEPFKGGWIPTDPEGSLWGTLCDKAPDLPHMHTPA